MKTTTRTCRPIDGDFGCESGPSGACVHCGHVTCLTCGTRVLPEAAHRASDGNRFCAGCWVEDSDAGLPPVCARCGGRTDGVKPVSSISGMRIAACDCPAEDDSDGVPLPVGDDDTSAVKTVRLQDDAGIVETGRAWAEDLCRRAA